MRRLVLVAAALLAGCPSDPPPVAPPDPPPPVMPEAATSDVVRRLTRAEYIGAVDVALGVDLSDLADRIPADVRAEGFTNTSRAQVVSLAHVEAWDELAAAAATRVTAWPACADFGDCEASLVRTLGLRIFRRPLLDAEVASLRGLFRTVQESGDTFDVARRLLVRVMLQSPAFLYRIEPQPAEGARTLEPYELATRLAFFLWGTGPDQTMLDAAASGSVDVGAEADRLLADERARSATARYVRSWLDLDALDALNRDRALYPAYDIELAQEMKDETIALFLDVAYDPAVPLATIFSASYTIASDRVASLYGFDAGGRLDLSETRERRGLLTHAGVLAIAGRSDDPSMVGRGLYVLETIVCGSIDSPPPNLNTTPRTPQPGLTRRTYSEQRLADEACSGCHSQFDPFAYALEPFDGIGVFRTEDEHGNPLRSDGALFGTSFDDPAGWAELLASQPRVLECLSRKQLQYALGRPLEAADEAAWREIHDRFVADGATYLALVRAIAAHEIFAKVGPHGGAP